MKTTRFLFAAGLVLASFYTLVAVNVRNSPKKVTPGTPVNMPVAVDCVFLGNSLVEVGCDMPTFVSAWSRSAGDIAPLNLALSSTRPEEHGVILKRTLELPVRLKYLIYGFVDDQLNVSTSDDGLERAGDKMLHLPRDASALYAPRPSLKWWQAGSGDRAPLLTVRSSLWNEVEVLRWSLNESGIAARNAHEAEAVASFNRRCEIIMAENTGFSPAINEIIRLAREHGATVVLVEMPLPASYRRVFHASPVWKRMRAYMQSLAWDEGAVFLTASDWVNDEGNFQDAAHLNPDGAKLFSARLAATLSRLESFALVEVVSR